MFFLIEIDSLGEQLEYYIRNIQQELKTNKYFSTGKLILYSKSNYKIYEKKEITDLLNILSVEYENLIYMENNDIENIINKKTAG